MAATPMLDLGAAVEKATDQFNGLTKQITDLADALLAPQTAIAGFVGALSPGLVNQFNYAVRTLNATIGTALAPAFQVLTGMVNDVSGALLPTMEALAPVMEDLAKVISAVLTHDIKLVSAVLTGFAPILKLVSESLAALTPLLQAHGVIFQALFTTISQFISSLFGADLRHAMDSFRNAVAQTAKWLVVAAAQIAVAFGQTGFLQNMKDALGPPGKGAAPAPSNVGSNSLESIGLEAAKLSILAGGGLGGEEEAAWRKDVLAALKDIDPAKNLRQILIDTWDEIQRRAGKLPEAAAHGAAQWGLFGPLGQWAAQWKLI